MLGMFCIRALSSLTRLWTATHIKLLHSLPGITVAQVCCCMFVCVCVLRISQTKTVAVNVYVWCVLQIDEEVAKLLQLKARLGGDEGKHQYVLKTAKVGMLIIYTQRMQIIVYGTKII